jgi:hypothetical protein
MREIPKLMLFLLAGAFLFCVGVTNAEAFDPILFGEEGAFLKMDFQGQLYGVWRDTGSGPDKTSETTDIFFRRNRLSFWGHGNDIYGFLVQIEYTGERIIEPLGQNNEPQKDFSALDAYFMADVSNSFRFYAGKQKIQLTRENLEDCFEPLSLDRSLFIYTPFKHSRDTGVVLWGNIPDIKSQYRVAASKGQDDNLNAPKSSLMYTGRFHVSLLEPEYAYGYKGTYLGEQRTLTIGGGVQYEPSAVYSDITAKTGAKDYTAWTADVFFNYPLGKGVVTASAAYLKTDLGEAYKGADPDPQAIGIDGEKKGWYAKAGYLLPGKKVQPFVRLEEWRFASLFDVFDQTIKWTGVGVNYFIDGQSLRVTIEYANTNFDKETNVESKDFKTVTTMLQYRF